MEIRAAVLDWLLEKENPSIRFRTLTELLGIPRSDAQVMQARAQIPCSPAVQSIMAKMHPGGYWLFRGKGENIDYACSSSTHFVLAFLAELGMDREDERIDRAIEHYLSLVPPDLPNLSFWQIPPDTRNHQSCLYAYNLRTFIMLGYRDDPRIRERVEVLLTDIRFDGGYLCDRPSFLARPRTKSCIRGSQKALMAFAALPEHWSAPRCRDLVEYFLRRRVFYQTRKPAAIIRPELTKTAFPFTIWGSLLESIYPLSKMGYASRPEMQPAWAALESKCDSDGRYRLDESAKTYFNPGPSGQPNKWVTFYALLALKYRSQHNPEKRDL